jgi:hypothetical protein
VLFVRYKKEGNRREKNLKNNKTEQQTAEFYSSLFFTQTELRENAKCVFSSHYSSRCFGRITSSFKEEELLQ